MTESGIHSITYVSAARRLLTDDELLALLAKSRDANARHGITGLLLYRGGSFMQAIEGPEGPLRQLYRNICADPTHHHVTTLLDNPLPAREFDDWHLGFVSATDAEHGHIPGYSRFLCDDPAAIGFTSSPSEAHQLLMNFRDTIR
jgi:hypothetical protein